MSAETNNGCPKCGFSYCSKCLKYKLELPKIGIKKVCGKCYNNSQVRKMSTDENMDPSSDSGIENPLPPIDITNKLELLENPSKPPIVMYKQHSTHWDKLKVGMDPADQKIIDRLRKLKDEDNQVPPPSIDEINRRLALLKNEDPENMETSPDVNIHHVDTRTNEQKRDDLLKQCLDQLSVKQTSVSDLQARLDALKDIDTSKITSNPNLSEDEDEETNIKKIIKRALEEAAIESKYGTYDEEQEIEMACKSGNDDEEEEEESMCYDCGDTYGLCYCKGCNGKLYCSICYEDNHDEDEIDMRKHIKVPFKRLEKHRIVDTTNS